MAYVNHNRILTVGSVAVTPLVTNVTIFSPTAPETRENGGDLLDGDRWINTVEFTESVYYDGRWIKVGDLSEDGDVDGGDSTPGPEYPFILDGGNSLPHADDVRTVDGGNAIRY